jgi:hypothetical protein
MSHRTDAEEFEVELTKFGKLFVDGVSNREQWTQIGAALYGVAVEGKDLISMTARDRSYAAIQAFSGALATLLKESLKFSDEETPV